MWPLCLGVLVFAAMGVFGGQVHAQQALSTDEIIQSLKPKGLTRSLSVQPTLKSDDAAFLETLKGTTRGLTVVERTKVSEIAASAALPSIDLEVNFALNSASLETGAVQTLQKLGLALKSPLLANGSFLIAGHTDASGSREYNQKLSEERARVVKLFLVSNFQISPDRLLSVGYGQEKLRNTKDPLADENRRVNVINIGQ